MVGIQTGINQKLCYSRPGFYRLATYATLECPLNLYCYISVEVLCNKIHCQHSVVNSFLFNVTRAKMLLLFAVPAKIVWALTGMDAELPCDVTPALPGDNVTMIFWFKDTIGMPLYR